jgi:hypothetical protein
LSWASWSRNRSAFGSAGCYYRYTIDPRHLGHQTAGGDQDQIGNFTIDRDGTATFDKETSISGPEGADLRATVSRVMSSR